MVIPTLGEDMLNENATLTEELLKRPFACAIVAYAILGILALILTHDGFIRNVALLVCALPAQAIWYVVKSYNSSP